MFTQESSINLTEHHYEAGTRVPESQNNKINEITIKNHIETTTPMFANKITRRNPSEKPKVRRSRNGCVNCKRLKIKCDEKRPSCEYCRHTKRECIYRPPPPKAKPTRKTVKSTPSPTDTPPEPTTFTGHADITVTLTNEALPQHLISSETSLTHLISYPKTYTLVNHNVQGLNSMLSQLNVTNFELRLLKHFVDIGGNFMSFGKNPEVHDFWEYEVPKMWCQSELMRNAMYALSSIQLWTQYKLRDITNVYVDENQSLVIYEDFNEKKGTTLYERTNTYFQRTLTLLKIESLDESKLLDPHISGQIIAANIIVFAFVSVHPISPVSLIAFNDGSNGFMVDIMEICRNFHLTVFSRYRSIMNTKYQILTFQSENTIFPPEANNSIFSFVDYLKYYVDSRFDPFDVKHLTYYSCINAIELCSYRAVELGYVMPIFRAILTIAKDPDFIHLVRSKDYTAMKLMFYYSCLCSVTGFKLFKDNSIWDNFVIDFKDLSFTIFGNKFEDLHDQVMYDTVMSFKEGKIRFELNMLLTIGQVDYRELNNLNAPLIKGSVVGYPPPPL